MLIQWDVAAPIIVSDPGEAIAYLRRADPVLGAIIDRVGDYAITYREPDFESLVRSIVYQQLSGRVAAVILERRVHAAGGVLPPPSFLQLRSTRMRALGLSTAKTAYIRDLARQTRDGVLVFDGLAGLSDREVVEALTQVKGIGEWTAHMFLMFALRRPDVLPTGDLGLRNAIRRAYRFEALPLPAEIERLAHAWRPWRSVATWYLWRSLDGPAAV
jgi:DNA-3-methyladenine glycosylase II